MLTDQDIAEANRALKELADEAQGNGNSEGWIAAQERPILAVIAAHEAKAAPAVPQGWKLVPVEPTPDMEGAGRVNMDYGSCTARQVWSAMLAATPAATSQEPGKCAQCKKPYRKGANTEGCPKCAPGVVVPESEFQKPISAPSQPVNRPQNCGTSFCSCIECVCEPEPVTLTDEYVASHLEAAGVKLQRFKGGISGTKDCWSTSGSQDVRKLANGVRAIIAALREKQGGV